MYIFFGIFLFLCILFFIINHHRKKSIIQKICCMDFCNKLYLLDDLMQPYGFSYLQQQNIVTSRIDAWQRKFGYQALFDKTADRFHMVFDCEPIYFDYSGRTWLIEFWKGQYGINIGGEIGIYYADSLLTPEQYKSAHFQSVPDEWMLSLSMKLFHYGKPLFSVSRKHWWLTGFYMGHFCQPQDLSLHISITFPNALMLQSFTAALIAAGYDFCTINVCGLTISFVFTKPYSPQPRSRFFSRQSQWKNRCLCGLYQWISRPFSATHDKLLYLYFFLPRSFRRVLRYRKNRQQKQQPLKNYQRIQKTPYL